MVQELPKRSCTGSSKGSHGVTREEPNVAYARWWPTRGQARRVPGEVPPVRFG
jgi:hypothetical protein